MPEPTLDEMLVNVRTAINTAIQNGGVAEYRIGDRMVRKDLAWLQQQEEYLLQRRASETPDGTTAYVGFQRPQ